MGMGGDEGLDGWEEAIVEGALGDRQLVYGVFGCLHFEQEKIHSEKCEGCRLAMMSM
jgi:hypothetical protein